MDAKYLDEHLRKSMRYSRESDNPNKGVVAAGLIFQDNIVYATSEKFSDGRSIHAERNVLREYKERYGTLPNNGAIMVATLSPCHCLSEYREGGSCIELLTGSDEEFPNFSIAQVYVGFIDPTQSIDSHLQNGFRLTKTTAQDQYFNPENYGKPIDEFVKQALNDI